MQKPVLVLTPAGEVPAQPHKEAKLLSKKERLVPFLIAAKHGESITTNVRRRFTPVRPSMSRHFGVITHQTKIANVWSILEKGLKPSASLHGNECKDAWKSRGATHFLPCGPSENAEHPCLHFKWDRSDICAIEMDKPRFFKDCNHLYVNEMGLLLDYKPQGHPRYHIKRIVTWGFDYSDGQGRFTVNKVLWSEEVRVYGSMQISEVNNPQWDMLDYNQAGKPVPLQFEEINYWDLEAKRLRGGQSGWAKPFKRYLDAMPALWEYIAKHCGDKDTWKSDTSEYVFKGAYFVCPRCWCLLPQGSLICFEGKFGPCCQSRMEFSNYDASNWSFYGARIGTQAACTTQEEQITQIGSGSAALDPGGSTLAVSTPSPLLQRGLQMVTQTMETKRRRQATYGITGVKSKKRQAADTTQKYEDHWRDWFDNNPAYRMREALLGKTPDSRAFFTTIPFDTEDMNAPIPVGMDASLTTLRFTCMRFVNHRRRIFEKNPSYFSYRNVINNVNAIAPYLATMLQ